MSRKPTGVQCYLLAPGKRRAPFAAGGSVASLWLSAGVPHRVFAFAGAVSCYNFWGVLTLVPLVEAEKYRSSSRRTQRSVGPPMLPPLSRPRALVH